MSVANPRVPIYLVGYALDVPTKSKSEDSPADPNKLKRETSGRYKSGDGRFTVEQGSGGWMIVDSEQTNELGLPLVRGPFDTLENAREGLDAARSNSARTSNLAQRIAQLKDRGGGEEPRRGSERSRGRRPTARRGPSREATETEAEVAPVLVRAYRRGDGDDLRALWADAGPGSEDDDDRTLKRFAERNPDLLLVATQKDAIVGSAMGAWDGRTGWIYHVTATSDHRRSGLATRLVTEVESRLRSLGATTINAIVRDDNPDAVLFWEAAGYARAPTRQFNKRLEPE
jgi:ribosomal protein S18 acetylase RimI-like enzyme